MITDFQIASHRAWQFYNTRQRYLLTDRYTYQRPTFQTDRHHRYSYRFSDILFTHLNHCFIFLRGKDKKTKIEEETLNAQKEIENTDKESVYFWLCHQKISPWKSYLYRQVPWKEFFTLIQMFCFYMAPTASCFILQCL